MYRQDHNEVARPARRSMVEPVAEARRLRLAMVAPPWIPVPPPGYGGIEFVLALLCDALVARGHDVELFCAPGSHSAARVRPLLEAPHPDQIERSLWEADHVGRAFHEIDAAALAGEPYDVVHDHCGYTGLAMADRIEAPWVYTVHGPFDEETIAFYNHHGSKGGLVCISHSQAKMAPPGADVRGVVHNPIDIDSWPVGYEKQDWLLWLGRFAPVKGPHRAIRVARKAGRPLVLAGNVQPQFERFFADEVQPHIDGVNVRYVGEQALLARAAHLADAFAFLMPIRWPEPFGMVMVESLAAGTPVLAFRQGAAPEIVEHGKSGFLVEDEDEMAAMVDRCGELRPDDCRASAERFSPDRVAAGYEAIYHDALAGGLEARRAAPNAWQPAA